MWCRVGFFYYPHIREWSFWLWEERKQRGRKCSLFSGLPGNRHHVKKASFSFFPSLPPWHSFAFRMPNIYIYILSIFMSRTFLLTNSKLTEWMSLQIPYLNMISVLKSFTWNWLQLWIERFYSTYLHSFGLRLNPLYEKSL